MSSSKATFLAAQTLVQINFAAVSFSPLLSWVWMADLYLERQQMQSTPKYSSVNEEGVNLIWETKGKGKERQKCVWDFPRIQWDLQNSLRLLFSSFHVLIFWKYEPALGTAHVKLLTAWSLGEFVRDSSLCSLLFPFFKSVLFFFFSHPSSIASLIHQTSIFT